MNRTIVLPALALVLAAACHSTAENRMTAREDSSEVFIGNPDLSNAMDLQEPRVRRGANDCLEFQATIANKKSSDLRIQWLVEWYDAQGFKLDDPTQTWHPAILNGKAELDVRRISPTPQATRAKIRVMPMDEIQ